jgi:hypothetical protein
MNEPNDNTNPFQDLFVDQKPRDDELLAKVTRNYVRLYRDTGDIELTSAWDKLNLQAKVIEYLLARKILEITEVERNGEKFSQAASPKEIEIATGIKGNSLRPTLANLLDKRFVRKTETSEGGKYYVPDFAIPDVSSLILDQHNDN